MNREDREFDLVLWGASGFTGALVAKALEGRAAAEGLRWALGGRNEKKLSGVREAIQAPQVPIVIGDNEDPASLRGLAERTRVVCTTVGPYARYGSGLVAACARAGTDYCDLTGEVHWIRAMIDQHEATARDSGARIVPTCGFDSIPSDIGVFAVQRAMRERSGAPSPHVKCGVADFRGGFSGGTIASMLDMLEKAAVDPSIRRTMANPYALDPVGRAPGRDARDRTQPAHDADFDAWTAPFIMAGINTRVVRRSNALLDDAYGADFRYEEFMLVGDGLRGRAQAWGLTAGTGAGMGALAIGPLRRLAQRWLPEPGEGPSPEDQRRGFWKLRFHADAPEGGAPLRAHLHGERDPGYGSTSLMLAESALCLACDDLPAEGGFWTPASALGAPLLDRLEKHAGVSFEVEA